MNNIQQQQLRVVQSITGNINGDPQRNPPLIQHTDSLGMESRRSDVEKIQETFVKVNKIQGWIKVTGVGELLIPITWPVWFIERPGFEVGYELDDASPLETGNFPTWDITICQYQKQQAGEIGEYWVAAGLATVIGGNPDQIGWINWSLEAKAMTVMSTSQSGGDGGGQGLDGSI